MLKSINTEKEQKNLNKELTENDVPVVIEDEKSEQELDEITKLKYEYNDIRNIIISTLIKRVELSGHIVDQQSYFQLSEIIDGALSSQINFFLLSKMNIKLMEVFDEKFIKTLIDAIKIEPKLDIPQQPSNLKL